VIPALLVFAVLSVALLGILIRLNKLLQMIRDILGDIRSGNLNQRFRIPTSFQPINQLTGDLNSVIEHLQTTVVRAQYLEESRKQMISNISHDLRTPLTSLLGYVEALQQDPNLTAEERARYLEIIHMKGKHLANLFQEFFELSKLESDDAVHKMQRVNLTEKLQEVLVTFYQDVVNAGLTPDLKLPEEPLYVWGDPLFLERVLNNLISNALRYGASGGVIGLAVRKQLDTVEVEVWDRGAGIPAHDLPYIFERLYTGEASRNKNFQGNGLGLTITKQLVEKMQGRLQAESIPHERTSFTFTLRRSS